MDDPGSVAIETLKCPIALINLTKARCTRAVAGIWAPLAPLKQFGQTVNTYQQPKSGETMSIEDYKRTMESNVVIFQFDTNTKKTDGFTSGIDHRGIEGHIPYRNVFWSF